jgi:hypothetical protein
MTAEFKKFEPKKYDWWDSCCKFTCPCGEDLVVDQDNGETTCRCSKVYRIVAQLEVKDEKANVSL